MNDLISRSALKAEAIEMEIFQPYGGDGSCMGVTVGTIDCAPAVDAEPVRHGRWILNKRYGDYECSECGNGDFTALDFKRNNMRYCPNCGAKMDGDIDAD